MRPRLLVGIALVVIGALVVFVALRTTRSGDEATAGIRPEVPETASADSPEATGPSGGDTKEEAALAPEVQVSGRVYDRATEEAIAGVAVRATAQDGDGDDPVEVLTSSNGGYRFSGMDEGRYIVSLDAKSPYTLVAREAAVAVTIRAGEPRLRLDFPLSKGLVVTGSVVFEDGEAAPGAVVIGQQTRRGLYGPEKERESIEADSEGRFELGDFLKERDVYVMAHSADATSAWVGPLNSQANLLTKRVEGIVLKLQPGSRIDGTAITTSSYLLPFATVEARRVDSGDAPYSVSADEEGRFSLAGILPGAYDLRAIPQELKFTDEPTRTRVEVAAGQSLDGVQVLFDDGDRLAIAGRVTNDSYEPIPEVLVTAEGKPFYTVLTDVDGNYTIPYLQDSLYEVTANHPEYAEGKQEVQADSTGIDFILQRYGFLEVTVLDDASNEPIPEFDITIAATLGGSKSQTRVHDPEGRHRLDTHDEFFGRIVAQKLSMEPVLEIHVETDGYQPETKSVPYAELLGSDKDLLFRLKSGEITMTGTVVNEAGEPVSGAEVFSGFGISGRGFEPVLARSNEEGRFEIQSFDEEINVLSALHPAYMAEAILVGNNRRDVTIILRQGATVSGTVRKDGVPVAGANLELQAKPKQFMDSQHLQARADAGGRYEFAQVRPGLVRVRAFGYWKEASVSAGRTTIVDFDIVTEGLSKMSGRVTVRGKAPKRAGGYLVLGPEGNLQKHSDFFAWAMVDRNGYYEIDGIPAGSGALVINTGRSIVFTQDADGPRMKRRVPVSVGENESIVVDVEMSEAYTLRGTVIGDFRRGRISAFVGAFDVMDWFESLPDHTSAGVSLEMMDSYGAGGDLFGRDGTFEIPNMEVGAYTFAIMVRPRDAADLEDFYMTSWPVEVKDNDENYVEISLP